MTKTTGNLTNNITVPSSAELRDEMRTELRLVRAERDRAQQACELMGKRIGKFEDAILAIAAIIETQSDPDIDAIHDVCRDILTPPDKCDKQ